MQVVSPIVMYGIGRLLRLLISRAVPGHRYGVQPYPHTNDLPARWAMALSQKCRTIKSIAATAQLISSNGLFYQNYNCAASTFCISRVIALTKSELGCAAERMALTGTSSAGTKGNTATLALSADKAVQASTTATPKPW